MGAGIDEIGISCDLIHNAHSNRPGGLEDSLSISEKKIWRHAVKAVAEHTLETLWSSDGE